ncbi:MAG: peptidase M24 [Microbacteriaceae bacterium]
MPDATMPDAEDRARKRERLARVRHESGNAAILLDSHEALSWYLDGARTHVSLAGPPVLAVRAEASGDTLFVAENEAERLIAEELLPEDAARVVTAPWQTPPEAAAREAGEAAPESAVAAPLRAARAALLPAETARYRALGREVAEVLTDAAAGLSEEYTERAAAAVIAGGLVARGIDPLVVLVAGAARLGLRHPLPGGSPLGPRAMLVVCGRRHGLIANATRWVGEAGADDERILEVEAAYFAATLSSSRLDEVFAAGCAAYGAAGLDPDEWRRHHQGGPTGYAGRDPRATALTTDALHEGQAFAWNPTAVAAKAEDTVLRRGGAIEVLTVDGRWPSRELGGLRRPLAAPYGALGAAAGAAALS